LTTETAPLTIFVHELFQMKKFITDNEELSWKGKLLVSSMINVMFQQIINNSGGEGYLEKYKKH